MRTRTPLYNARLFLPALFAGVSMVACGPQQQEKPPAPAQTTETNNPQIPDSILKYGERLNAEQRAFFALMLPKPRVTKCQLDKVEKAFGDRVFHDKDGISKVKCAPYVFSIQSFRSFFGSRTCTNSSKILLIRYGLDDLRRVTYGLAITCASEADRTFTQPIEHYMPDANLELRLWAGAEGETWQSRYGARYTATGEPNIFVKQSGFPAPQFDPTKDTYFVTHDIDRILAFLDQNTTESPNHERRATHVEIVSFAHKKKDVLYHHGAVLVALDADGRMIDSIGHGDEFYMKGVDLGSPCPENCNTFTEISLGIKVDGCAD